MTDFGGATDRYGNTDHTAAYDSAGLPTDAVDSSEYESFEMPSVPERTARHSARGTNSNTTSSHTGKSHTGKSHRQGNYGNSNNGLGGLL